MTSKRPLVGRSHSNKNSTIAPISFQEVLNSSCPASALRRHIHARPLAVFWVSPYNQVIDASSTHNDNPPYGDRSVLADKTYKRFLRGRAAYIGNEVYVVIYYWPRYPIRYWRWRERVISAIEPLLKYLVQAGGKGDSGSAGTAAG